MGIVVFKGSSMLELKCFFYDLRIFNVQWVFIIRCVASWLYNKIEIMLLYFEVLDATYNMNFHGLKEVPQYSVFLESYLLQHNLKEVRRKDYTSFFLINQNSIFFLLISRMITWKWTLNTFWPYHSQNFISVLLRDLEFTDSVNTWRWC